MTLQPTDPNHGAGVASALQTTLRSDSFDLRTGSERAEPGDIVEPVARHAWSCPSAEVGFAANYAGGELGNGPPIDIPFAGQRCGGQDLVVGVASLPEGCDLSWFGLDPSRVSTTRLIRITANHELYQLTTNDTGYVLKWFPPGSTTANEVSGYQLLRKLGVPTIPVAAITDRAVLLADLACSKQWRLGEEEDMNAESTGSTVAVWYRRLHDAGRELARESAFPDFLHRQSDQVGPATLRAAGERFNISSLPSWRRAVAHHEDIVTALRAIPETLNHNDFHHNNLALPRRLGGADHAVVFDYDLLGVGPRVCDYRNVTTGLGHSAARSFAETYGPLADGEFALDAPVAVLAALVTAARRRHVPAWALPLRQEFTSGAFDRKLTQALAVLNH